MPELSENTIRRIHRQIQRAERGEFDNPPLREAKRLGKDPTPRVVLLLEDCESGGRAEAAVLIQVESSETQIVQIEGTPESGTFRLEFDGKQTGDLAYNVSAADLQTALEQLPNIKRGDVIVELGPAAATGLRKIYRWLVHFTGRYYEKDVPLLLAKQVAINGQGVAETVALSLTIMAQPDLEDCGETLEVLCVVPLPPGVKIFAGNVGIALPVPSFGYCLTAAECRDADPY